MARQRVYLGCTPRENCKRLFRIISIHSLHTYFSGVVVRTFDSRAQMSRRCLCSSSASVLTLQAPLISSYETSVPEATGSVYYKHAFVYMHDGISAEVCLLWC